MNPERWRKVEEVYHAVIDLESGEQAIRLDELVNGDNELRAAVRTLIKESADTDTFLEKPVLAGSRDKAEDASFSAWLHEGQRIGQYRIDTPLGEGGMGVVYLAEQEQPRRTVALKIIKPALAKPALLRRFQHEAQILGRLHHPGIAQIFEAGMAEIDLPRVTGGPESGSVRTMRLPFFAMEHVDGAPLNAYLTRSALTFEQRVELAARICDAVQHAHQRGVVHRDLKPANILIVDDGDSSSYGRPMSDPATRAGTIGSSVVGTDRGNLAGRPKILDFGVARLVDADANFTTIRSDVAQILGTLPYMSPEQVTGDAADLDTRSDIYTLGVNFYEMLGGALPHAVRGCGIAEAARIIQEDDPKPLGELNTDTRGDVETIIAKAMAKHPDHRYASAAEFANDLRRHLRDEPILAKRATPWEQIRKFGRRNKALAAGVIIGVFGIFAGSGFAIWKGIEASIEREAAIEARDEAADQAAIAEAVNQFLNDDLLSSVDPELGRRDTTVLEVLDNAADAVETKFRGRPKVESAIRYTLGRTYFTLSENEKAEAQHRKALALREAAFGPDHEETLHSASALGAVAIRMGRYDEAETLLLRVTDFFERAGRRDSAILAEAMIALGGLKSRQGQHVQAAELLEEAIEVTKLVHEHPENRTTLNASYMLAAAIMGLGRHDEARVIYERVASAQKKWLGDEHPHTLRTQNNLALLLKECGELDKAEPLLVTILEIQRKVLGNKHIQTIITAGNLAILYDDQKRYDNSEPLLKEVVEMLDALYGPRHPHTLNAMNNLAASYRAQGRAAEAEPLWLKTLEIQMETLGPDHPATLISRGGLARLYTDLERFEEAEKYAKQCHAGLAKRFGPDHGRTHVAMSILCQVYKSWDRMDAAPEFCIEKTPTSD